MRFVLEANLESTEDVHDGVVDHRQKRRQDGHQHSDDGTKQCGRGDDQPEGDLKAAANTADEAIEGIPDARLVKAEIQQAHGDDPGDEADEGHGQANAERRHGRNPG